MSASHSTKAIAALLHAACLQYRDRDWVAHRKATNVLSENERESSHIGDMFGGLFIEQSRPGPQESEVVMFPQTWGSTALGFDDIGNQETTDAYTIIVECEHIGYSAVLFGGRLAYLVPPEASDEQRTRFAQDMAGHKLVSCADAGKAYGAIPPFNGTAENG